MRNYHLSTFLGLTATMTIFAPRPVQAATLTSPDIDYSQLQLIKSKPIVSSNSLSLQGYLSDHQGVAGFYNLDPSALDHGHKQISLNSRQNAAINNAPYYINGRPGSPEVPSSNATRTSSVNGVTGFLNFSSYLTSHKISPELIGYNFGQKNAQDFTKIWNLGSDQLGVDWYANPNTPVEERIYKANPKYFSSGLYYGTKKIVDFGYSNLNVVLDYKSNQEQISDTEADYTNPAKPTKMFGLSSVEDDLANAFLQDVNDAGGGIQLVFDGSGSVNNIEFKTSNGYGTFLESRSVGDLRVVPLKSVPENSSLAPLIFGAFMTFSWIKKNK